jgi:hypothetical protein
MFIGRRLDFAFMVRLLKSKPAEHLFVPTVDHYVRRSRGSRSGREADIPEGEYPAIRGMDRESLDEGRRYRPRRAPSAAFRLSQPAVVELYQRVYHRIEILALPR